MAVINLESLVLRGVTVVLCDGLANNPRLGTGYAGMEQTTTIGHSMQHPSTDMLPPAATADGRQWQAFCRPAERIVPAVSDRERDAVVGGAGWSLGFAGHALRRHFASSVPGKQTLWSSTGKKQANPILAGWRTRMSPRQS
jgi:hypothetical protein